MHEGDVEQTVRVRWCIYTAESDSCPAGQPRRLGIQTGIEVSGVVDLAKATHLALILVFTNRNDNASSQLRLVISPE